jgi:predicted Zn-dependent peptidase
MVMTIVGDVDPAEARRLADKYFGGMPAKPRPPLLHGGEPTQWGPKTVALWVNDQPLLLVGYKRPDQTNHDDAAFDVIRMILARDRNSLLYKELVEQKKMAQSVDATATFPAGRYMNLFLFTVVPAQNHTALENEQALYALLSRFEAQPVDAPTLARVKNEVRVNAARLFASNRELAALLPTYLAGYGDWRKLFTSLKDFDKVTAEDVQRAALQYFVPPNRTVAYISNGQEPPVPAAGRKVPQ